MSSGQLQQESRETLKDSDFCPICGGCGHILVVKDGIEYAKECDCYQERLMLHRLKFASLPESFKGMELKTFSTAVYEKADSKNKIGIACRIIKRYLENFEEMEKAGMGLYLFSDTKGSGKTRMVASIANELMRDKNRQVKFATSTAILKEIKNTWDRDNRQSESKLLDDLSNTTVLIIDDFGTEKVADWINDKFYHIINERYMNRRITMYTSNEPLEKLSYDDRITSRIKEATYQIAFPEESVREHISERNNEQMLERILTEEQCGGGE